MPRRQAQISKLEMSKGRRKTKFVTATINGEKQSFYMGAKPKNKDLSFFMPPRFSRMKDISPGVPFNRYRRMK